MSYDKLKQAKQLAIGTKQTAKAIEQGHALEVFVAKDADPRMASKIVHLCNKAGVAWTHVDTMKGLGKACGIEVGAAAAAIIKE